MTTSRPATGGAGQRAGQAEREPAHVDRVHAVDVLVGVHRGERDVVVEVPGHRVLHEQPMHRIVGAELGDHPLELGLAGVGRQVRVRRHEAQVGRLPLLDPDVAGTGVIVTDQDGGERGRHALVLEDAYPVGDLAQDAFGDRAAGQKTRGHGYPPSPRALNVNAHGTP
jgi:hypothetical protein